MKKSITLMLTSLLVLMTSCTNRITPNINSTSGRVLKETLTYAQRAQRLNHIQSFVAHGAIAVKEGRQGFSANMTWSERSYSNYKVDLYGPFGAGHITLDVTPSQAILKDSKNQVQSNSAERLLQRETRHHIPLNYLKYWLKGIPKPNLHSSKKLDNYQRITQLSQAGWVVTYLRYKNAFGMMLPTKLRLQKGTLLVKISIHRWR